MTAEQLNCTPAGQVKLSYASGADVHSVLVELAQRLRSSRTPTAASIRERARETTGFSGKSGPTTTARFGEVARPGCRVEKLVYESEPGISVPALLFIGNTGGASRPAVLLTDGDGKTAAVAEAEELAAAGFIVLAPDLRGFGETKPNFDHDYFSRNFGDYEHATTALLIGKTMPGMRALDAVCGIDLLAARSDVDKNRIGVVGRGAAAVAILFAALLEERISRVALDRMLVSYNLVATERIHQGLSDQIVPSVLKYFDLPDVIASLAPRRVAVFNGVNQLGQELAADRLQSEYARAGESYAKAGAASALRIGVRNRDETTFVPIVKALFEA